MHHLVVPFFKMHQQLCTISILAGWRLTLHIKIISIVSVVKKYKKYKKFKKYKKYVQEIQDTQHDLQESGQYKKAVSTRYI
jgi:hypothetical protein